MRAAFFAPAAILFTIVMIVPVVLNLGYAFTNWDGFSSSFDFVGLDNFARAVSDPVVRQTLLNTLVFTLINAPLQVALGLLLALALKQPGRTITFLRTVIVFPIAISGVVLGVIGDIIFSPSFGLLDAVSQSPGWEWLGQNWLGDPSLAMFSVIAMNLWQWTGVTMLVFIAGLNGIPSELYEAARIDGAGAFRQFQHVSWPLLAPAATINIVLTIIGGLKVFDIIYILTSGGPGVATRSVVMQVATQSSYSSFGYAASISLLLTVLIFVVTGLLLLMLRRREISA